MKVFFIAWILIFFNVTGAVLANKTSNGKNKFVTLVYPVRGRNLWADKQLYRLEPTFIQLKKYRFPSTWLLHYDALTDKALLEELKNKCFDCEWGILLEVSEPFASEALVSYKVGEGDWTRPDKTFLSGYGLLERERLIDKVFARFKQEFGFYPTTIGAWYIDPYSLVYIKEKYAVTGYVSVADQYDTDGQRFWGKPWGVPYYPQKYNSLAPANSGDNKLDVVQLQWALRHPSDAYGSGVPFSQNSLQANDYVNNKKNTSYFVEILSYYLDSGNPFSQVTIGLEVGQELFGFESEHLKQLEIVSELNTKKNLGVVTIADFTQWYRSKFPKLSPLTVISDGKTKWINTNCYRLGISYGEDNETKSIFDLRIYSSPQVSSDYETVDRNQFLSREIPALVENIHSQGKVSSSSRVEEFGEDWFVFGERLFDLGQKCGQDVNRLSFLSWQQKSARLKETFKGLLSLFKTSVIDGQRVLGVQTGTDTILAFWLGRGVGNFTFPFQTLSKFVTLGDLMTE